tara:strand:+ start:30 stop:821 length:792 start_codon:yes stop_codon:yes gene_type:complete
MKRLLWISAIYCIVLGSWISSIATASAHVDVVISNSFSRTLPPNVQNGAVFLEIVNKGEKEDFLIRSTTPIARAVEFHQHTHEDGLMRMKKIDSIPIIYNTKVSLSPGGLHIMLLDLKQPLIEGENFPLTLFFKKSGDITISVPILGTDANLHTKKNKDEKQTKSEPNTTNLPTVQFELVIKDEKVQKSDKTFRVKKGEIAEFRISSNEPHVLHLHGYDIEFRIDNKSQNIFQVKANATGRFPVEIHGAKYHHTIFYLEVYPK